MTTRAKLAAVAGSLLVAAVLLIYHLVAPREAPAQRLAADDPDVVRRGAEVYRAQCATCHGEALEGQPHWRKRGPDGKLPAPPHDASGHTWHHRDELLIALTRDGPAALAGGRYESNMPGYAGVLDDADIRAVLSYIKSTWPPAIRRRHDELNARAPAR